MKKSYPASKKATSSVAYHKHLKPEGKRRVNKSTRRLMEVPDWDCGGPLSAEEREYNYERNAFRG